MTDITAGKHIRIEHHPDGKFVVLCNPDAPPSLQRIEAGRIISTAQGTGFQPAPFLAGLLSPDTLRHIADIIEEET